MIRFLIADDEPPARALLREYLSDIQGVELLAECENGAEAVALCNALKPDAVIFDVQMPALTGFEVIERLEAIPFVIFSTAYNAFAVRAFEENAVDYLMKPYSRERFARTIERLHERIASAASATVQQAAHLEALTQLLNSHHHSAKPSYIQRLMVKSGSRIIPLLASDILWIEAAEDYATLHLHGSTYLAASGIGELEKRLDPHVFMRVHRSAIINTSFIKHVESDSNGNLTVTMANNARVKVSRSYTAQIRGLIV